MNRTLTAVLLIATAVLTNTAFVALGSIFNYPDVLKEPATDILTAFRADQGPIVAWFTVLAVSAALFAPIAIGVGRLSRRPVMTAAVAAGIAAAVVQVIGLSRWPVLVPRYAADNDVEAFQTAHRVLGTAIGETLGYALTATWIILVLAALGRAYTGRWFVALGGLSAVLIATGVLSPLGVPGVGLTNFIGYVAFSLWMLAFAGVLLIKGRVAARTAVAA